MSDLLEKCSVCGGLVDEEDLFCANCGTAVERDRDEDAPTQGDDSATTQSHHFECNGCGASMSFDASAGELRCPFCGGVSLEERSDVKSMQARRAVPFTIERNDALRILRKWLGRGFWRPGDLARIASVRKITPVFLPYWVFRAQTHTYWTADTSQTPSGARGDWYPLTGEHRSNHAGLLVGASGALTPHETAELCPFDLGQAASPNEVDTHEAAVEQFRVKRKYARPLARQGMESSESETCTRSYVPGRCRNMKVNVRIENLSSEPVLFPVWIMAYQYKKEAFRFLINGQTGKATGRAPTSWRKVAAAIGIAGLVILVIIVILLGFGR